MSIPFIIVCIIVAVVVSVFRAKKIAKEREEERKKAERKQHPSASPSARTPSGASSQTARRGDPFPTYRGDPFAEAQGDGSSTLSPAQLNEWLIDFRMAEQAHMSRPPQRQEPPRFARYLHAQDFNYRGLRKRTGYAPQNRLPAFVPDYKTLPARVSTVQRNDVSAPILCEKKDTCFGGEEKQFYDRVMLPEKTITQEQYEGQYKNVN